MREIGLSEFRVKCSVIIEQVRKTRQPVRVMRLGEPLADIVPLSSAKVTSRRLGSMAGAMRIIGDIVGPTGSLSDWDAAAEASEEEPRKKPRRVKSSPQALKR
jgi:antitoxin (DNA-binding transcriptional repressor) of toxin-antitoxin stability system